MSIPYMRYRDLARQRLLLAAIEEGMSGGVPFAVGGVVEDDRCACCACNDCPCGGDCGKVRGPQAADEA